MEYWDLWRTPDDEEVRVLADWPRPPQVRGPAAARAGVQEAALELGPYTEQWTREQLKADLSEALVAGGWEPVGIIRVANLAAAHLKAAVRQAELSARHQERAENESVRDPKSGQHRFFAVLQSSIQQERAVEASRTAVVLAVAALEAHINEIAKAEVVIWGEAEDKMSLESKWVIVPALLMSGETFDKGAQPFQDFHDLNSLRNRLVHPKPSQKRFTGEEAPREALVDRLRGSVGDVGVETGRRACGTARRMLLAFASMTDRPPPFWCAVVPPGPVDDLGIWTKASFLHGGRKDPDFPALEGLFPPGPAPLLGGLAQTEDRED